MALLARDPPAARKQARRQGGNNGMSGASSSAPDHRPERCGKPTDMYTSLCCSNAPFSSIVTVPLGKSTNAV